MDSHKSIYFPPLRKNYFRSGNQSVQPNKKDYYRLLNHPTKHITNLSVRVSKNRDLRVSQHYIKYHKNIVNQSRVSLLDDINTLNTPHKAPINLVKIHDYELERWRLIS